jgi:sugar transferase EpsL
VYGFFKRFLDVVGAGLGLIVLAPLLIIVSIAIVITMGRPIFFTQVRTGYQGKPFKIIKFRTMRPPQDNEERYLTDAQRITPLGSFLRKSSIDELPELVNVLKGDMSLVGPRPLLLQYLDRYTPEQARRHEVRPGITGWAQVNGRNTLSWEKKFALDIWYVAHRSLWLDLKILVLTVIKVVRREGISAEGEATMPEFMGSNPNVINNSDVLLRGGTLEAAAGTDSEQSSYSRRGR